MGTPNIQSGVGLAVFSLGGAVGPKGRARVRRLEAVVHQAIADGIDVNDSETIDALLRKAMEQEK